jgi:hypothetical protein
MMLTASEQQATGLERFELLGDLHGVDVFDMKPIEMTRMGTLDDPIPIFTLVRCEPPPVYLLAPPARRMSTSTSPTQVGEGRGECGIKAVCRIMLI